MQAHSHITQPSSSSFCFSLLGGDDQKRLITLASLFVQPLSAPRNTQPPKGTKSKLAKRHNAATNTTDPLTRGGSTRVRCTLDLPTTEPTFSSDAECPIFAFPMCSGNAQQQSAATEQSQKPAAPQKFMPPELIVTAAPSQSALASSASGDESSGGGSNSAAIGHLEPSLGAFPRALSASHLLGPLFHAAQAAANKRLQHQQQQQHQQPPVWHSLQKCLPVDARITNLNAESNWDTRRTNHNGSLATPISLRKQIWHGVPAPDGGGQQQQQRMRTLSWGGSRRSPAVKAAHRVHDENEHLLKYVVALCCFHASDLHI